MLVVLIGILVALVAFLVVVTVVTMTMMRIFIRMMLMILKNTWAKKCIYGWSRRGWFFSSCRADIPAWRTTVKLPYPAH